MNIRKLALFAAVFSLVFAAAAIAADSKTKLYKWVDKDGVVHYGSSVPPEYASQQNEQLNAQGQVVKVQSAQKTPEQAAAEAKAQQQAKQDADAAAAQKAKDKVLLDTYTSVADIERDRDSKLSAIDAQITVLNGSITSSQKTLAEFQSRANELVSKDKPVPPDLQKHIDGAKQQLIANQQQLLQQQQYKQQMQDVFVKDISRYRELTGQAAPAAATSHG
jgi:chromosome segregation ATPase